MTDNQTKEFFVKHVDGHVVLIDRIGSEHRVKVVAVNDKKVLVRFLWGAQMDILLSDDDYDFKECTTSPHQDR